MNVIKKKRVLMKMTQDGLAEKLSVSRQSVISWERYDKEPSITNIVNLSKVLRIGITTIIKDYATHIK